jgi:hypothetical protein
MQTIKRNINISNSKGHVINFDITIERGNKVTPASMQYNSILEVEIQVPELTEKIDKIKIVMSLDGKVITSGTRLQVLNDIPCNAKVIAAGAYASLGSKLIGRAAYDEVMAAIGSAQAEADEIEGAGLPIAETSEERAARLDIDGIRRAAAYEEIPAHVLATYRKYHGEASEAANAEDEAARGIIIQWAARIEAIH